MQIYGISKRQLRIQTELIYTDIYMGMGAINSEWHISHVAKMPVSDTAIDGSNPSNISMLCARARHLIHIASVNSVVK